MNIRGELVRVASCVVAAAIAVSAAAAPQGDGARDCLASRRFATDPPRIGERFPESVQDRYRVTYRSESRYDFSALFDAQSRRSEEKSTSTGLLAQSFRTALSTRLKISVAEVTADRVLAIFQFVDPDTTIEVSGLRNEELSARVRSDLAAPILGIMDSNGRIREISMRRGSHSISQGVARSILSLSQFVTPEGGKLSKSWTTSEDDPSGTFQVRYVRLSNPGERPFRFRKTRRNYAAPPVPAPEGHVITLRREISPSGSMKGVIDPTGALRQLGGVERQTIKVNSKQVGSARSEFHLDLQSSRCMDTRERFALLEERSRDAPEYYALAPLFSETITAAERERVRARSTLGADTLDTLLASLDRVASGAADAPNKTDLYLKLKSLAQLHPDASAAIGNHVAGLGHRNPAYVLAVGALRAVGDEQAQAALVRLLGEAKDVDATVGLLLALDTVVRPSAATIARFEELAGPGVRAEIASTAQLGLGVFARKIYANDPAKSDAIVRLLVSRLKQSTDVDARRQWVLALGNAGTPSAFEAVAAEVEDPDPTLRSTALMSLRWQQNSRAEDLLVSALRDDASEEARVSAAQAMAFRSGTPALLAALASALASDPSAAVRRAAVDALAQSRATSPKVRALLDRAARDDLDEGVREAAKRLQER
jgi:HEAT repeat protein